MIVFERKYILLLTFLSTLFFSISVLSAEIDNDVTIKIHSSVSIITFGDSLSVFCDITAPDEYRILEPLVDQKSPDYDIQKQQVSNLTNETDHTEYKYIFLLYSFAADSLSVGPFTVEYIDANGKSGNATSGIIVIPVISVVEANESSPLPNRNPFVIKPVGIPVWLIVVILILIALCVALIFYYFRKKNTPTLQESVEPVDEIAEFLRLKDLKLYESGYLKELYVQISLKMRGFLNRNLEFDALNDTTEEIENELAKTYKDKKIVEDISKILKESDSVKYAKYNPSYELSTTVIDRAIEPVKVILDEIAQKKKEEAEALKSSQDELGGISENIEETVSEKSGGNE